MCTVTWLPTRDGYELRMNRDELRTRAVALPPAIHERDGVRYVAPRDVDGGGTWIAANEAGVSVCLLNGPDAGDGPLPGRVSRGLLVERLAGSTSVVDVRSHLSGARLRDFAPFTLLALEPLWAAFVAHWNGRSLVVDSAATASEPLTSSSVDRDAVVAFRTAIFREVVRSARGLRSGALEEFHRGHGPERGHRSVCMHRPDASTVSYTRVTVTGDAVCVHYEDGPPCNGLRFDPVALTRRSRSESVVEVR